MTIQVSFTNSSLENKVTKIMSKLPPSIKMSKEQSVQAALEHYCDKLIKEKVVVV